MNRFLAFLLIIFALGSASWAQPAQSPPPPSAKPTDKDAYVMSELGKLFAGAAVRITVNDAMIGPFQTSEMYDAALISVSRTISGAGMEDDYRLGIFSFPNDTAAKQKVQETVRSLPSPVAAAKTGYDEFYSAADGRMVGRFGSLVVQVFSSSATASDSVLTVLATNVQANTSLFPNVVRYAYSMHFGNTAPLTTVLSNLKTKVPELLTVTFDQGLRGSIRAGAYGANSVQALYSIAGGGQLTIVAKAYDSDASAKTALMYEMNTVSVGPDVTKPVRGGTLYEYSRYSGFRMHIGVHTFDVHVYVGPPVPSNIVQKVSAELIDLLAPR